MDSKREASVVSKNESESKAQILESSNKDNYEVKGKATLRPGDVIKALQRGSWPDEKITEESLGNLRSRVIMIPQNEAYDPRFPLSDVTFAFCGGPDCLYQMMAKTQHEWLLLIGFEDEWIRKKHKQYNFKLLIFESSNEESFAPTWENIFTRAIPLRFPGEDNKHLRNRILSHQQDLTAKSFNEIEEIAKHMGFHGFRSGENGHGHLATEEFIKAENHLVNCRRFLRSALYLTPLFRGDGYTGFADGRRGVKEYMVLSRPINELTELEVLDLTIQLKE